uniref:Uncharacterized protein n=1 Tax=Opuntia streptacantha TaxID=393608 RepID=A0A7C8ZKB9_OPUST
MPHASQSHATLQRQYTNSSNKGIDQSLNNRLNHYINLIESGKTALRQTVITSNFMSTTSNFIYSRTTVEIISMAPPGKNAGENFHHVVTCDNDIPHLFLSLLQCNHQTLTALQSSSRSCVR